MSYWTERLRRPTSRRPETCWPWQAAKDFLAARGIATLSTAIAERAAYRDVFDKGGLLQALNPLEVSNLARALENGSRLAVEVMALLPQKTARAAAPRKAAIAKAA